MTRRWFTDPRPGRLSAYRRASLQNGEAVGNRIGGQETTWKYYGDGTPLATAPVVNNGNIFVTGLDGNLYVFGTPGRQAY